MRRQKLIIFLIKQVLFSFEMREYASFAEMNMILWPLQNHSHCRLLIVEICVIHLRNFKTLIYWKTLFLLKYFSSLKTDFACHVLFFLFFYFLIRMTTETTHNPCSSQIRCSIPVLIMMLNKARVKKKPSAPYNLSLI